MQYSNIVFCKIFKLMSGLKRNGSVPMQTLYLPV